jgi:hypothetical protein
MAFEDEDGSEKGKSDLQLIPLCTMRATLGRRHDVGRGPMGTRIVFDVVDAVWEGDRLRGRQSGSAGADWFLLGPGGVGTIDVRLTMRTHDDAVVYVAYTGRTVLSPSGAHRNYVAPVFETGDERYAWLNGIQAVGRGDREGEEVVYRIYELR